MTPSAYAPDGLPVPLRRETYSRTTPASRRSALPLPLAGEGWGEGDARIDSVIWNGDPSPGSALRAVRAQAPRIPGWGPRVAEPAGRQPRPSLQRGGKKEAAAELLVKPSVWPANDETIAKAA
ncbi:hypothetical protein DNX69_22420 [Rhodopseudomonas palustris]|uniref:Uncharacterized protein n=1 Tax=Rhodopseudomonas palustris TaxID=1076 RepID=A0A323UBA8_RHOPL|nr:hypothetical protein DNX69_22420 [Rhodopseudomonas palustris]